MLVGAQVNSFAFWVLVDNLNHLNSSHEECTPEKKHWAARLSGELLRENIEIKQLNEVNKKRLKRWWKAWFHY